MATATKQTVPPAPPAEILKSVTLVLTPAEARTLTVILAKISGDSQWSPRLHARRVLTALEGVGIFYYDTPEYLLLKRPGGIFFDKYANTID